MKYECKHAYEAEEIPYIVCDREPKPSTVDKSNLYHSLCPYQRFCGKKQCAVLLPAWERCKKNATDKPQNEAGDVSPTIAVTDKTKNKSQQKRKK